MATAETSVPEWFSHNINVRRTDHYVDIDGCKIHYMKWGDDEVPRKKPGLVLLHGNFAHAHWWTPIAPFWADQYVVVALSLSAHGQSGWRPQYTYRHWAAEVAGVAKHAGFSAADGCILVAHSMGVLVATAIEKYCNGANGTSSIV